MKLVTPQVRVLAKTDINWSNIQEYLQSTYDSTFEFGDWGGEDLIEFLGRLCYRSFDVGLNPNVTKIRTDKEKYFENILSSGHGSILEHVSVTFLFSNVSRVFTHELVRHRVGSAFSQESLRYVRIDPSKGSELRMVIPDVILKGFPPIIGVMELLEALQTELATNFNIDNEKSFTRKKELTSAFRRFLPIGIATSIGWTASLRTLFHVIPLRTAEGAEWEIRQVFRDVGTMVKGMYPNVFRSFELGENGAWTTPYHKP